MANQKKKAPKQKKQPKFRGHYCKICDTYKANEKYSGKGHNAHICKSCASKSPVEKAEDMTLNKLERMALRYINKEEIKWLENRMKDKRPEVREMAEQIHNLKFPHYERNEIKKTLKIISMDFRVHDNVWDEYGDECPINVGFQADTSGKITRTTYDENNKSLEEKTVEIGQSAIRKLFNIAVHEYNVFFWDTDLCREISYDPNIDVMSEFLDDDFDFYNDEFDEDEDRESEETDENEVDNRELAWSVNVKYKNGPVQDTIGYDFLSDEVESLFWEFEDYFVEEEFDDDFEEDDYN